MRVQIGPHADLQAIPRTLYWGKRRIEIIEIIDQWYGPGYRYVKVKAHNSSMYILCFDEISHSPTPFSGSSMTWLVQPSLVNEPFSDPGLFIDFRFGRRALLFDLGDLTPVSPRQLLRVTHAFVSHTHMDHFAGFDRLLRVCLHRTTPLHLIGPVGFADRVEHKLRAYTLNLLDEDSIDFVIVASEFSGAGFDRVCEFRAREAFLRREIPPVRLSRSLLLDEEEFRVEGAVLDHGIPCLAFALEEKLRVNVWREGLRRLGLPVGPWLREAKRAVRQGAPDHRQVCVHDGLAISLGDLKQHALRTARGQKIAYVVDLAYDERNIKNVVALARDADQLFIEAPFLEIDANIAAERQHLTAHQAGHIAKQARVGRLIPFHFSARYRDRAEELTREAEEAFSVSQSPKLPD
jgi:ribonuclease Z